MKNDEVEVRTLRVYLDEFGNLTAGAIEIQKRPRTVINPYFVGAKIIDRRAREEFRRAWEGMV